MQHAFDPEQLLARILRSVEFDGTPHAELLEYICVMTQQRNLEDLREHDIGVAVFGLQPGYDVSENPMVRTLADELREKLTRFFGTQGRNERLRVAVPKGEFRAFFYEADPSQVEEIPSALEMFWMPHWQSEERSLLVHGALSADGMLIPEAYAAVQIALMFQQHSRSIELLPATSFTNNSLPSAHCVLIGTPETNPMMKRWLSQPPQSAILQRVPEGEDHGAITIIAAHEPAAILTASRFATTDELMARLLERTGMESFPPGFLLTLA